MVFKVGLSYLRSSLTGPSGRSGTTALDLGELEQVLLDEEIARRLQEEEARLATEVHVRVFYY